MNFLKYIKKGKAREPKPLRIEGCSTVPTPEPDDAELAARALLESLSSPEASKGRGVKRMEEGSAEHDASYYRSLSDRIRDAHRAEAMAAVRYVAWCERELHSADAARLGEMERGLYRHADAACREKGDLKARWQRCLAEVIVRQMDMDTKGFSHS